MNRRVYDANCMSAAGFEYTGVGDTARCKDCGLEVSNWTLDMKPFDLHMKQKPDCPFIRRITTSSLSTQPSSSTPSTTTVRTTSIPNERENPCKRQKIETIDSQSLSNTLLETDSLQQVRRRTFSHWPHHTSPSSAKMIEAGFFNCNVGDRVICLYCNRICQQRTPHTDDPCEVHRKLSPNCIYVKAKLIRPSASSIIIVNESSITGTSNNHSPTTVNLDPLRSDEIVFTAACNTAYAELSKRHASFATWPRENLPPIDDLVQAVFFYSGTETIATCFYCNGSLQNWGRNDNPMVEHARWFPHCAYAKQLCGDEIYRKIQESKCAQQERAGVNEARNKSSSGVTMNTNVTTKNGQLLIPDESTLSRLGGARLDLPISQRLSEQGFKLSIIKRCSEDQLRLEQDDFASECDLYVARTIPQKQIEHVDGKKENIVIPRLKMKHIRECEDKEGNITDFTEGRTKTIEREKSFIDWPHISPSRRDMFTSGWSLDTTKEKDFTVCPYCGVEFNNWESNDNPMRIHCEWSTSCPFVLSKNPMHPSSISIQRLDQVFTPERIASEAVQPTSNVILTSNSPYAQRSERQASFSAFPDGPPPNVDALVASGFYHTKISTLLQCQTCAGNFIDLHQCPANEINTRHYERFPQCRFAQLLPRQAETRSTNNTDRCKWCTVDPKELAIYPCMHLAVCRPCAQLISLCPVCGIQAEAFVRLYMP